MNSSMEYVLLRAFVAARSHGYHFNLVEIPNDVDVGKNALAFDPKQMRTAFDAGLALGKQPDPWKHAPPNLGGTSTWGDGNVPGGKMTNESVGEHRQPAGLTKGPTLRPRVDE